MSGFARRPKQYKNGDVVVQLTFLVMLIVWNGLILFVMKFKQQNKKIRLIKIDKPLSNQDPSK
jgi:hypothetical protein